jgi:hypothetical protein
MTPLQTEMVQDLLYMEKDMGAATITWPAVGGTAYPCVASITSFSRELDTGGYRKVQELSATLRILNCDGTAQFTTLPTAQQTIIYSVDGLLYRITSVKLDPTGSHFRLVAEGPARGV